MYNFSKVYLEQIKGSFGTVATLESEDRVTKKETTALAEKQLTEGSFLCHFEDFFKKFRGGATCIRIFTNETSGQQQGHQLGAHGSDKKGKCFLWHFESRTEKGQMLKMSEGETFQSGIVVSKEKILRFYFLSISWSLSRSSSARPTMKRTWSFPIDLGSTTTTRQTCGLCLSFVQ